MQGITLDYTSSDDTWDGKGALLLTGPQIGFGAHVRFKGGKFVGGDIKLSKFPGVPLYSDVYLNEIDLSLSLDPNVMIGGGAVIGALPGPSPPFPVEVDGHVGITIGSPFLFTAGGEGKILSTTLATASFVYSTSGYAKAHGQISVGSHTLGFFVSADLGIVGHAINGVLKGDACAPQPIGCFGVGELAFDSKGVALCATSAGPSVTYEWASSSVDWHHSCASSKYKPFASGASHSAHSADAGRTFTVPPGLPSYDVRVAGVGGAPSLTLVGPAGQPIVFGSPTDPHAPATAAPVPDQATTYLGLSNPPAGTYTLGTTADSVPIDSIMVARGYTLPNVNAHLAGRGRNHTLAYQITGAAPGVGVDFVERGPAGDVAIGSAAGARGSLRFAAGPGPGGTRVILARTIVDGLAFASRAVSTYTAPGPPQPGIPGAIRLAVGSGGLSVQFGASANANVYLVSVALPHRVRVVRLLAGNRHSVFIPGIARRTHASVNVVAISRTGARSPTRTRAL